MTIDATLVGRLQFYKNVASHRGDDLLVALLDESAYHIAELTKLREIVAAMWEQYNYDQGCDQIIMNGLTEEAAEVVAEGLGGYEQLDKIGDTQAKLRGWR